MNKDITRPLIIWTCKFVRKNTFTIKQYLMNMTFSVALELPDHTFQAGY